MKPQPSAAVQSEPMFDGVKLKVLSVTSMFWLFQRQLS